MTAWRQRNYDSFREELFQKESILRLDPEERLKIVDFCDHTRVRAVPICEPAKVRMVTVGCGYQYSLLQPLQGYLIDCWKNHQCSTMVKTELVSSVQKMKDDVDAIAEGLIDQPMIFCSGDYSSATDLMKAHATTISLRSLRLNGRFKCVRLDGTTLYDHSWLLELADMSLRKGELRHGLLAALDAAEGKKYKSGQRIDGQLMGHPLSFPILCAVNLACLRLAARRYGAVTGFYELADKIQSTCIVNGDDILFRCPLDFMPYFRQASGEAGF